MCRRAQRRPGSADEPRVFEEAICLQLLKRPNRNYYFLVKHTVYTEDVSLPPSMPKVN